MDLNDFMQRRGPRTQLRTFQVLLKPDESEHHRVDDRILWDLNISLAPNVNGECVSLNFHGITNCEHFDETLESRSLWQAWKNEGK